MRVRSPVEILLVEEDRKDVELPETTLRKADDPATMPLAASGSSKPGRQAAPASDRRLFVSSAYCFLQVSEKTSPGPVTTL